jgi:hypothetical protein
MANINDHYSKSFGTVGNKIVTGTTAVTVDSGTYFAVQFITDCTPTVLTMQNGVGTFSGIEYAQGTIIYGDITAITAGASETYILYKK